MLVDGDHLLRTARKLVDRAAVAGEVLDGALRRFPPHSLLLSLLLLVPPRGVSSCLEARLLRGSEEDADTGPVRRSVCDVAVVPWWPRVKF